MRTKLRNVPLKTRNKIHYLSMSICLLKLVQHLNITHDEVLTKNEKSSVIKRIVTNAYQFMKFADQQ